MTEELQTYIDSILEQPGNFVHCYGSGLLMVKFKVNDTKYEIVFDENLEVEGDLSGIGEHLDESAEFYKINNGCTLSMSAPDNWIFMNIFQSSRNRNANGPKAERTGSSKRRQGS